MPAKRGLKRWVSLSDLSAETGIAVRTLQYIRAQEPGVLISRTRGKAMQYEQPACAINLRAREVRKHMEQQKPANFDAARTLQAQADAEMAVLKLARMRAEQAPVVDMDKAVERLAMAVRAEVSGLRARFAARIVGLGSHIEAAEQLDAMAQSILAALVDAAQSMDYDTDVETAA